jgi:hypothetical protein
LSPSLNPAVIHFLNFAFAMVALPLWFPPSNFLVI